MEKQHLPYPLTIILLRYSLKDPRHFAPARVLFRLCNVCLPPESASEPEQIHIISGDARLADTVQEAAGNLQDFRSPAQ